MPVLFSLPSVLGRTIRLTEERWALIVTKKHPVMHGRVALVRLAILDADFVVQSRTARGS
ncbi:hypothetical protein HYV43_02955 [Candidatus Micrarchaeota archaeon]|nr:hypothetical protein [Candidatus Micrarchaeota archaeon]